jgi:hypothetical protein
MPKTSPERGADAISPRTSLDHPRFPFISGIVEAFRCRGTPLVPITDPDDRRAAIFKIPADAAEWECLVLIDEHRETVEIRSILPIEVPPERLETVATLAAHLNATSLVGHFAIEPDAGRILHVSRVRLSGSSPSPDTITWLLGENLLAVDLHVSMFLLVAWAEIAPEAAIGECGSAANEAA